MSEATPKIGDLRIWWIPQIPMEGFHFPVSSPEMAADVLKLLAEYDKFQFEHNVKPDYSNAGGLEVYVEDSDGKGNPGWEDWMDETGLDIDEWAASREQGS